MTAQQDRRAPGEPAQATSAWRTGAYPAAAAAFAARISYVWGEAAFRLLFTHYPGFDADWVM